MVIARVDELYAFTLAVRDSDELCVRNDHNALRLAKSRHTLDVIAALQVEHFDRVVAESRNVQPLRSQVDSKVIDAPLDAREIDRADQSQRCLTRRGLNGDDCDGRRSQERSHDYSLTESVATFAAPVKPPQRVDVFGRHLPCERCFFSKSSMSRSTCRLIA